MYISRFEGGKIGGRGDTGEAAAEDGPEVRPRDLIEDGVSGDYGSSFRAVYPS